MTAAELCRQQTSLNPGEVEQICTIAASIQIMADLTASDIFIDVMAKAGGCIVAAEAKPAEGVSVYGRSVAGEDVNPEHEPAVYTAFETGMPVRDIRAITQENRQVRQDVVPIHSTSGKVIGVLIREKDISERAYRDRKYEELAREKEQQSELLSQYGEGVTPYMPSVEQDRLAMKEIHHRVKNNLQMAASILNIQSRNSSHPEVKAALKENVSRILSFASIHDILTRNNATGDLSASEVIGQICKNVKHSTGCSYRGIDIACGGDDIRLGPDQATSIAIVVNELVMNAVEHAFNGRDGGVVQVWLNRGNSYATVTVSDNGGGFTLSGDSSFGLDLVNATVQDKLGGKLHVTSGSTGSRISFDFLHQIV